MDALADLQWQSLLIRSRCKHTTYFKTLNKDFHRTTEEIPAYQAATSETPTLNTRSTHENRQGARDTKQQGHTAI